MEEWNSNNHVNDSERRKMQFESLEKIEIERERRIEEEDEQTFLRSRLRSKCFKEAWERVDQSESIMHFKKKGFMCLHFDDEENPNIKNDLTRQEKRLDNGASINQLDPEVMAELAISSINSIQSQLTNARMWWSWKQSVISISEGTNYSSKKTKKARKDPLSIAEIDILANQIHRRLQSNYFQGAPNNNN